MTAINISIMSFCYVCFSLSSLHRSSNLRIFIDTFHNNSVLNNVSDQFLEGLH